MPSQSYIEAQRRSRARTAARKEEPFIRSPTQFKREIEQLEKKWKEVTEIRRFK